MSAPTPDRCRFCPDYATRQWEGVPACRACFLRLVFGEEYKEKCEGCGRTAAAGCDCDGNRLAIGRGERAKGEREEE